MMNEIPFLLGYLTYFSPANFYESAIFDIEDLMEEITVDLEISYDGKSSVLFTAANYSEICGVSLYHHTEYYYNGRCFSILLPNCILRKEL